MDFFSLQDSRRKQSAILILFFIVAMLAIAVVVHVVAVVISMSIFEDISFLQPTLPAKLFIALIWGICFIGCFFRIWDVKAGGASLAKRFGAVEVSRTGHSRAELELYDIVQEMAIASSCTMPEVFVLHNERSINAFVVGGFNGQEAIVVSQGALDRLAREQLTAVVAHEFAHIVQGDIALNMRLLVVLGGLYAIDDVGKILKGSRRSSKMLHPGVIVGSVVRGIGSIGIFLGRALTAALSRQREFMADAHAVQFTRMPEQLAAALVAIQNEHDDVGIHSRHANSLAHLCFHVGESSEWQHKLFATHPPIQERIDVIDPHAATKLKAKRRAIKKNKPSLYKAGSGVYSMPMSTESASPAMMYSEVQQASGVSDLAAVMLADVAACVAVLHAIFVSADPEKIRLYYEAIAFAYNKAFAERVADIRTTLSEDIQSNKMAVVDIATAEIAKTIQFENRQRLLQSLERLLSVEDEYTLLNYATLQLVRRKLDAEFPVLEQVSNNGHKDTLATGAQAKTFDSMGGDFAVLLSLIVEASGNETAAQDDQFQLALKCYTKEQHAMRSGDEAGIVTELEDAFQTLYIQPRAIREAFVRHCIELAQADGHIANSERAMLDLFAASLKCDNLIAA